MLSDKPYPKATYGKYISIERDTCGYIWNIYTYPRQYLVYGGILWGVYYGGYSIGVLYYGGILC